MPDFHSALKTSIDVKATSNGLDFLRACLQRGKDQFEYTVHAAPTVHSTSGVQRTDFLKALGLARQPCAFHSREAYCGPIDLESDVQALADAVGAAYVKYEVANKHLEACGLALPQTEGWGYFYGKPSIQRQRHAHVQCRGNGHVAPKVESQKRSEDDYFQYTLTWIDGAGDKGWTIHYRPKHMPMSREFSSALQFIGGFSEFGECPEFDFDQCWWRFVGFRSGESFFDSNAEVVHSNFSAHTENFAIGIQNLLEAHSIVEKVGFRLLPSPLIQVIKKNSVTSGRTVGRSKNSSIQPSVSTPTARTAGFTYDVAFSFAGTERETVEQMARKVRDAGFKVFYDNFYPEQLWGEDLTALFDRIYRKESRFCVMFISKEYEQRLWTTHERRSATARMLAERGSSYILPVHVEDVDIDGLPPTLGHISLAENSVDEIADILIRKLGNLQH